MKIATSLLAAVVVLSASACGSGGSEPTVTVTETSTASVHNPPDFSEEDPYEEESDAKTPGYLEMESAWVTQDQSSKDGNCYLYNDDPAGTVDLYMDFIETEATGDEANITRDDVDDFLDDNC